jgi:dienelactone hydrolase
MLTIALNLANPSTLNGLNGGHRTTLSQWQQRHEALRQAFIRMLGGFPTREPVSYEVLEPHVAYSAVQRQLVEHLVSQGDCHDYVAPDEEPDNPAYRRVHIRYPGAVDGQPVYAYLRIPKDIQSKAPAVLCLHGHVQGSIFGKEFWDVTAIELTQRGYVTLTPDMLPFGERRDSAWDEFEWENGKGGAHFWGERTWFQTLLLQGQTLQGLHVWELRRAIDLLQTLPYVDADRIGVTGHSGGGINTVWLAAMDERVACAAASAGVMSYAHLAQTRIPNAVWCLAPVLTVGDTSDLLSLIAPRPFLGVESATDAFGFDGEYNGQHVYPPARRIYELYGASEELKQIVYNGNHDYRREQRQPMYEWLDRWLQPAQSEKLES